jgi:hypothetical protein
MKKPKVFVTGNRPDLQDFFKFRQAFEASLHYLQQLPLEKVILVRESLALDLKYYRTSRLTPPERSRRNRPRNSGQRLGD